MDPTFRAPQGMGGRYEPPPDKSITHRALMLATLASETCRIQRPLATGDCVSTRHCLESLGAAFNDEEGGMVVHGVGLRGMNEPARLLDTENSGTTTRLLSGILAGQKIFAVISGDASLIQRPMGRVVEPLRKMGARIEARQEGKYAPLCFLPGSGDLTPLQWELPVASAQVKSSLMLAALRATGASRLGGMIESRDHTERMFRALSVKVERIGATLQVTPVAGLPGFDMRVPGDISSAAFFIAASLVTGRSLTITGCGINPTRCGFLSVARRMGATVEVREDGVSLGEPTGTVTIQPANLQATRVEPSEVPELIDEIPLLAVLGLFATGVTEVRGAEELRFKESDRLSMIAAMVESLGGRITLHEDGFSVEGPQTLRPGIVDPKQDHRIAMAAAVAGVGISGGVKVRGFDCARVSYPDFIRDYIGLGGVVV
jgi:3-phosphoshikimate 1-carboxyvinyltransferase